MAKKKTTLPKEVVDNRPPPEIRYHPVYEEMQRLRHCLIFHSQAYYGHDITFVHDSVFDKWARRLVEMQEDYPDFAKIVPYAEEFADWDGSTGFHLVGVDEAKFRGKIYRSIQYKLEHEPQEVTPEMTEFIDNIERGIR
jgi:hypothetical protein